MFDNVFAEPSAYREFMRTGIWPDGTRLVLDTGPARMIRTTEDCYSCHQQHAAVDTTFVQFYPTLLKIATLKGTLSPRYQP